MAREKGPFVGVIEIICGTLLILGLLTRLASISLIVTMLTAIVSTKIPILLGYEFLGFALRTVSYFAFWGMAHEMRTDWAMLLGSIFLLITGADRYRLMRCFRNAAKATMATDKPDAEFRRDLTLVDAVGVGIGAIIGAGIFAVTSVAAGVAGPAFL